MKKIFTLALVATAVAASASAKDFTVQRFDSVLPYEQTVSGISIEKIADSRADDALNLAGTYMMGLHYLMVENGAAVGEFIENGGNFEIAVDPDVENGYIIKNLFYGFLNAGVTNEEELVTVNDLKATFDNTTKILSIAPRQILASFQQPDGAPFEAGLVTVDGNRFDASLPYTFRWNSGLLTASDALLFGRDDGQGVVGLGYQVNGVRVYIPNGQMTYETVIGTDDAGNPITGPTKSDMLCVWREGAVYIVNFCNFDPYSVCCMFYAPQLGDDTFKYYYTVDTPAGFLMRYAPTINPNLTYDGVPFYPCYADDQNKPAPTGGAIFDLEGTITNSDPDNFEVSFPYFGLFSDSDELWATYRNAKLKFNAGAIAGIENVAPAAADNTNAPVVYYNLQGMRVANPANGGIYIRVQGTDVEKILVK